MAPVLHPVHDLGPVGPGPDGSSAKADLPRQRSNHSGHRVRRNIHQVTAKLNRHTHLQVHVLYGTQFLMIFVNKIKCHCFDLQSKYISGEFS